MLKPSLILLFAALSMGVLAQKKTIDYNKWEDKPTKPDSVRYTVDYIGEI